jgi:5-hydroxyisourate hydrolase-like protein (transthyretin family)
VRRLSVFFLCLPAAAQISGVVVNQTTGKPQPNASVGILRMTANGPQPGSDTKSDAEGKFSFSDSVQGPTLVRATWGGVTYTHVLTPGAPTANITVDVYQSSKAQGPAKVARHMILFQPGDGKMTVNEIFLYINDGKTSWNDPSNGTLHFFLPPGNSNLQINATSPGGMAIPAPSTKAGPNVYKVDFPVKPGETRFDLSYDFPYKAGDQLEGKVVTKDDNTYLIVPNGVTLAAEHLNDLGLEPKTQAHVYGLNGTTYSVQLAGAPAAAPADAGQQDQEQDPPQQVTLILPRIYKQVIPIMAICLGILGLGFVLLYRKEEHGRQ